MKKRAILTSIMSIVLLAVLFTGVTYALFTSEDRTNIAVTSGKVNVDAWIDQESLKTYFMGDEQPEATFQNGGFVEFDENSDLKLSLLTPGSSATFTIKVDKVSENVPLITLSEILFFPFILPPKRKRSTKLY